MPKAEILSRYRQRSYRLGKRHENGSRLITSNSVTNPLKPGSSRPNRWSCSASLYTEY